MKGGISSESSVSEQVTAEGSGIASAGLTEARNVVVDAAHRIIPGIDAALPN